MINDKIDNATKKLEEAIAALDDIRFPPGAKAREIAVAKTNAETALLWVKYARDRQPPG